MKIAIFGGAFNPPHLGHLLIAKQVLEFTDQKQVWLMPCYKHNFQKPMTNSKHRLNMVRLLENKAIKVSDIEISFQHSGNTFDTMNYLAKKYPQHQFSFVIGSDNLADFNKWDRWQKLVQNFQILVFPRYEFDYDLKKYSLNKKKYKFKLIRHPLLAKSEISSTLIRNRLSAGLSIDYLLPEKIRDYIREKKLYRQE